MERWTVGYRAPSDFPYQEVIHRGFLPGRIGPSPQNFSALAIISSGALVCGRGIPGATLSGLGLISRGFAYLTEVIDLGLNFGGVFSINPKICIIPFAPPL